MPLFGPPLFFLVDILQRIPPYYPVKDMSKNNIQVQMLKRVIGKGLCAGMLKTISKEPDIPLLTSYMTTAIAADLAGHKKIYCILCDSEVHRAWVAENPKESKIQYFAPCNRTVRRLKSYGVPETRIFLTGFPFPDELLGGPELHILKEDIVKRLSRLDPDGVFKTMNGGCVGNTLELEYPYRRKSANSLTLTFAVGGAGAQRDIGYLIAKSLRKKLESGEIRLNLVAGIRSDVEKYFTKVKKSLLPHCSSLQVIASPSKEAYFNTFSELLRITDILWTKPSELSFYAGLGLPLIIAPPIGSHEVYNKKWLVDIHAGIPQEDPRYTGEWLFDLLRDGHLADIAWNGFLKVRQHGVYRMLEILKSGK
jgi:hypothetical protein